MIEALDIWVQGVVQGVGFRPFVYRLAKRHLINGWVLNAADGVHIHAEGETKNLDAFVIALSEDAPAAADVKEIDLKEVPLEPFDAFEIRFSDEGKVEQPTLISPDLATCPDCERELFDPDDRRFRYPFINCTNCGPRFTIIDELPYDRAHTSMADFTMCETCQAEYDDPLDRRFHAQPNACFTCGPVIGWREGNGPLLLGDTREASDKIFARAIEMIMEGKILAVKGLGGFHLVCDANNPEAVRTLRERKHRDGKPFAVMMRTVDDARLVCTVNEEEEKLLTGTARPIVLLPKRQDVHFTEGLADQLPELGVMFPYTPVQHILMHDLAEVWPTFEPPMLVMTSGNVHDEPIVIDNETAYEKLGDIADAFLVNNRRILERFDDSVVRILNAGDVKAIQFVRRARGYCPAPLETVSHARETIFATGPEQKVTFCFQRGEEAFVSQHIGDMENAAVFDAWLLAQKNYRRLFDLDPQVIACDLHPEYLTSKWAHDQAAANPALKLVEVQHHHAHIVSVMSENAIDRAVCGIAFDGTGYGPDGNIWGGEVLLANLRDYERFANFAYCPMPGGAAAIKHPLRMAYGVLWEFDLLDHPGAQRALEALGEEQCALCEKMIDQGINTPYTSSVGRLFDAASALLGICEHPRYEGEGAVLLEAALNPAFTSSLVIQEHEEPFDKTFSSDPLGQTLDLGTETEKYEIDEDEEYENRYVIGLTKNVATSSSTAEDTSVILFDAQSLFTSMLDDVVKGTPLYLIARRFHEAFVRALSDVARVVVSLYGIDTFVLSGGCFMNRYLAEHTITALALEGYHVAINRDLPPNDGCISLGQAVVASRS